MTLKTVWRINRGKLKVYRLHAQCLRSLLHAEVIYFRMPKVASGSITEELENNKAFKSAVIPHSFDPSTVKAILNAKNRAFRFTMVRHPYTRFASAYKWAKRANINPIAYPLDIKQSEVMKGFQSINDFAVALPALYEEYGNHFIHFTPQTTWLWKQQEKVVDFTGKYEDFDNSMKQLSNYGVDLNVKFGKNDKNDHPVKPTVDPNKIIDDIGLNGRAIDTLQGFYGADGELLDYDL